MNETFRPARSRRIVPILLPGLATMAAVAAGLAFMAGGSMRSPARKDHSTTRVQRTDLHVKLKAGGRLESFNNTLIECQLERLHVGSAGGTMTAGGSSTILELAPEGTKVRRNDILCRLDASDYEELVRQQEIKVRQTHADLRRAQLDVESAKMALREFRDGLSVQDRDQFRGAIALSKADIQRQRERLEWSKRMKAIGYLATSRVADEEIALKRLQESLATSIRNFEKYEKFGAPKAFRTLESQLDGAVSEQTYQELRAKRQEERLAHYRRQVELCTVRAPHDGYLIYANDDDGDTRIEVGSQVRQKQDLFHLPDLGQMEVLALLNQSTFKRLRKGMSSEIRVEAMPDLRIEGHVESIDPLPVIRSNRSTPDVVNFVGHVQLHSVPEGLRPGMTAEVEIVTARRPNALVVPPDAVAVEQGHEFCYVAREEGFERREVSVGEMTDDLLEVTKGLNEGEEVAVDAKSVEPGELTPPDGPAEVVSPAMD